MLGDSISITINAVAKVMPKINQDVYSSEYYLAEATQEFRLKIRHQRDKPKNGVPGQARHTVDLEQTIYAVPGVSAEIKRRFYTVIVNSDGDATATDYLIQGVKTWLSTANAVKVMGWES